MSNGGGCGVGYQQAQGDDISAGYSQHSEISWRDAQLSSTVLKRKTGNAVLCFTVME